MRAHTDMRTYTKNKKDSLRVLDETNMEANSETNQTKKSIIFLRDLHPNRLRYPDSAVQLQPLQH